MARKNLAQRRPAELGGAGGAIALLIGRALGIDDPDTLVAMATLVGLLPAGITWVVELTRK